MNFKVSAIVGRCPMSIKTTRTHYQLITVPVSVERSNLDFNFSFQHQEILLITKEYFNCVLFYAVDRNSEIYHKPSKINMQKYEKYIIRTVPFHTEVNIPIMYFNIK